MQNVLQTEIQYLSGVGPKRAEILKKELDISTISDLLHFFPFRYVDKSTVYAIRDLVPSMAYVQVRGRIRSMQTVGNTPKNQRLVLMMEDSTGMLELVFFKGAKWIASKIAVGKEYIAFGRPSDFNGSVNLVHPELTPVTENVLPGGCSLMGVYPSTEKLKANNIGNKVISKLQEAALEKVKGHIQETLPVRIIADKGLMPLADALYQIHFPGSQLLLQKARLRLKWEELFYLQLGLLKQRCINTRAGNGFIFQHVGKNFHDCYNSLPYQLTNAQKRVIREIHSDMKSGHQMNRLLQGDVGSGKTLVALLSALLAIDNGHQACIMAPTEVLAQQHLASLTKFLQKTGVRVALLTGSTKQKDRKPILSSLADGEIDILVGTHALIEDNVVFKSLGLAVIDEQHRFGVEQRSKLWNKNNGMPPHILVMTATPIPRTLAMTLYGDLDVSVIDELPPGRKPVKTIHAMENQRRKVFDFMREQIRLGRQIFVVYPLIKESEKMDYKNLEEGYQVIVNEFKAPDYVTAVVHGKQKNEDKAYDMELFKNGRAHIMVATSVIEVGVDVPNASVMVIESAERFGLSQLHQLRGRVGRGSDEAFCILMTGYALSKESRQRIELMCNTSNGFELAEADLRMRGPGDLDGTVQSGLAIKLNIANLGSDGQILEDSRRYASALLEKDPDLSSQGNALLRTMLQVLKVNGRQPVDFSQIS